MSNAQLFHDQIALSEYADSNSWLIRYAIARNTTAGSMTLANLAEDKELLVRYGVASNPNTSIKTLTRMVSMGEEYISSLAQEIIASRRAVATI